MRLHAELAIWSICCMHCYMAAFIQRVPHLYGAGFLGDYPGFFVDFVVFLEFSGSMIDCSALVKTKCMQLHAMHVRTVVTSME